MTNTHKHSRRLTTRREEVTRHTKILFREPTKPRAQHAQTTREDTDQGGRSTARPHTLPTSPLTHTQTTESDLTSPMSAFSGCSSSPAQLKSGPAPAATASETAAGRLGHRTGMPAAPDAAAPASAAASGRQHSFKWERAAAIWETSTDFHLFWLIFCFQRLRGTSAFGASVLLRSYAKLRYSSFGICPCVLASLECKGMQQALRWPGERII